MMTNRSTMWLAAWMAMLPWIAPTAVLAGPPAAAARIVDLELQSGGVVKGQVVNGDGQTITSGDIKVIRDGKVVATTRVGRDGRFELRGLQPGTCQLQLLAATQTCRLWATGTAPPKAPRELLVVTGKLTARGQNQLASLVSNPLVLGIIVAAAVAIPLAVKDGSGS